MTTKKYRVLVVDALLKGRPIPDEEYVITSGCGWALGLDGRFCYRNQEPMKNLLVLPFRLAKRMQEFTGGSISTVTHYLTTWRIIQEV